MTIVKQVENLVHIRDGASEALAHLENDRIDFEKDLYRRGRHIGALDNDLADAIYAELDVSRFGDRFWHWFCTGHWKTHRQSAYAVAMAANWLKALKRDRLNKEYYGDLEWFERNYHITAARLCDEFMEAREALKKLEQEYYLRTGKFPKEW
jgi:hypothetical protein